MQYLVNGKEMKLLDQNTSNHFHVPELVLMEQAAMAFVQRLFLLTEERKKVFEHVLIVCGSGNNGADGLAIARLLTQRGVKVMIVTAGEAAGLKTSDSYNTQKDICKAYGIPMTGGLPERMQEYDLIIDAVFGTGLSRKVEGPLAHVLGQLNESAGFSVPSVVHACLATSLKTLYLRYCTLVSNFLNFLSIFLTAEFPRRPLCGLSFRIVFLLVLLFYFKLFL